MRLFAGDAAKGGGFKVQSGALRAQRPAGEEDYQMSFSFSASGLIPLSMPKPGL